MEITQTLADGLILSETAQDVETVSMSLAGTAATITDTTVYPVADQDGKTSIITVDGTAYTVLFAGATTTAAGVAAQMNSQIKGASVGVAGGQVKITTDSTGSGSALVAAAGTGALTWDAPVAGTGQSGTVKKGTLLARNTATKNLTVYVSGGGDGTAEPVAVMPIEVVWTGAGNKQLSVIKGGKLAKNKLVKHDDATALDVLVLDKLHKNSAIVAVTGTDLSVYSK